MPRSNRRPYPGPPAVPIPAEPADPLPPDTDATDGRPPLASPRFVGPAAVLGTPIRLLAPDETERRVRLPAGRLFASPLNPRKHFNHDDLLELAESIAQDGLLQPLTVRPDPAQPPTLAEADRRWEVYIGGRRLRAIGLLIEAGRWSSETPLDCVIRPVDDLELLRIATVENVQRADMHPLEEGEAFAELMRRGLTGEAIASQIGKQARWVHLRARLATALTPEAKAAFLGGKLSLAQAREMARAPADRQAAIVVRAEQGELTGWQGTAESVRHDLFAAYPRLDCALFDRALYDGPMIEDDPETGEPARFQDLGQFVRLQSAALAALAGDLRAKWAWVERKDESYQLWAPESWNGYIQTAKKITDPKKHGAVIAVNTSTWEVRVWEGIERIEPGSRKAAPARPAKPGAGEDPVAAITTGRKLYASQRKTMALQTEIARNHGAALRLAVMGLLGIDQSVRIKADDPGNSNRDNRVVAPAVAAVLEAFAARLPATVWRERTDTAPYLHVQWQTASQLKTAQQVWALLRDMPDTDLHALLDALVAARCGSFATYQPELGDDMTALLVAEDLAFSMQDHWQIDAGYLATLRKSQLLDLARAIGGLAWSQAEVLNATPEAVQEMKVDEIRKALLDFVAANDVRYVPPELQFGTRSQLEETLRGPARTAADSGKKTPRREPADHERTRARKEGQAAHERGEPLTERYTHPVLKAAFAEGWKEREGAPFEIVGKPA